MSQSDTNRTMVPTPGDAIRRTCGRCGHEIDPFEAHHAGLHSRVRWCDSCYLGDCNDE